MPKEVIQHARTEQVGRWGTSASELSVHWNKDQEWVQLGLTRHVGRPRPEAAADSDVGPLHADHSNCAECQQVVAWQKKQRETTQFPVQTCDSTDAPPVSEFDPPATVFTDPMDRRQINSLIKTLRRARDQAHGEDV